MTIRLVTPGLLIAVLLVTVLAGAGQSRRTATVVGPNESAAVGGPLVLMGIDAEDQYGEPGQHGPISVYVNIVNKMLDNVTNGGSELLVIGGGKDPFDDVTTFWEDISDMTGRTVVYVNLDGISAQSFAGFALIAVVSSSGNTPSGGLTQDENNALATRENHFVSFVNSGGALLGFTQSGLSNPYDYLAGFGGIINTDLSYSNIDPTPEGLLLGITNDLDVSAWHDEYMTFPSFLVKLATNAATGNAAAIGGRRVMIPPNVFCCIDDTNGSELTWNRSGEFSISINGGAVFMGTGVVGRGAQCTGSVMNGNCTVCLSGSYIDDSGRRVELRALKDICSHKCLATAVFRFTVTVVRRIITDTPGVGDDCPF